ncbi:sgt-related protein [Cryptosporidium ubiquitum]|uniref:Sgt-related protein n=1 Tax=Cryptosporidium ubiquitum TaxID=857276 RepID=A0A1J4MGP2_9CRYT|nr:sgt-related protein [Cryptosporidium ubiquitum]OII73426.1 sgt-related protein [Cryptosporidium ubiquitum]
MKGGLKKNGNMENFSNAGSNDLLEKILELTKNGYDYEEVDGGVELRFFYLNDLDGGITLEKGNAYINNLFTKFIELGIFEYNWDTVPFSLELDKVEGVDCVKCWLNLSTYHLDEWYTIYLCYKVTENIENLAVQAVNSDGDPILIDLADILPVWMKPNNSENRCFLVNGKVYLIPPELLDNEREILSLKSALDIIKFRVSRCYTKESFTNVFMEKFESISKINQQEKSHNFYVILPRRIAEMVLEFHYLLVISLKYLLYNRCESSEVRVLEKKHSSDKGLNLFLPKDLIRIKICMTRTQYSRFINEALFTMLPSKFSRNSWINHLPENLQNKKFHSELLHGCLLTYGIYLAYLINPSNSLGLFIWKFTNTDYFKLREKTDFQTIIKDSLELMKDLKSQNNDDFRTLWIHLTDNLKHLKTVLPSKDGGEDGQCDSTSWMNNEEYSKKLIEDIQKIYSENSQSFQKRNINFTDILEENSYFDGIELNFDGSHSTPDYHNADFSDLSLESDLSEHDFEELDEIMRKMDDELKRTLKTSIPTLNDNKEARRFAENTYSNALKLEETFGIVGPATVFNKIQK